MIERTYNGKDSNVEKLTNEIIAAGIAIGSRFFGVTVVSSGPTTIVYVADDLTSPEAATIDSTVAAHVPQTLAEAKVERKAYLQQRGEDFKAERYAPGVQESLHVLYSNALRNKPNRFTYIQPWVSWLSEVDVEIKSEQDVVDTKATIPEVNAVVLDEATLIAHDPLITVTEAHAVTDATSLDSFLDANAVVTDGLSGVQGAFYLMQELMSRRELYNDAENPLYAPGFVPILGAAGWAESHADRIELIETIHGKLGWHNQQVEKARYRQPKDLLIYYGWLNSFNSAEHAWDNEKVALEMSRYGILVFGDGVQDPSHGDYANTQVIIPRIKALNPSALIFGYVTTAQAIGTFQSKVDQWNTLGVHGIFMDEAGYDYGKTRAEFNARVDYVHGKSIAHLVCANSWNTDHILGTANDPSYPNSTYNPSLVASSLTTSDWALLESFPINTSAYVGSGGYEAKAEWAARGSKMTTLRATYGVNFAAVGVINDANAGGAALFQFGFVSAMMFSLEAFGTSDTDYGSSSAKTKFWGRPNAAGLGDVWTENPSVQNSTSDNDVYYRYTEMGCLELDFSSGAQLSYLRKTSGQVGFQGAQGWHGQVGTNGVQGVQGGLGSQGAQGPVGSGTLQTCKAPSDSTNNTVTPADATGLSFSVAANTDYAFEFFVVFSTAATTTGIRVDVTGPASPTELTWVRETMLSGAAGTDALQSRGLTGYLGDSATASIDSANTRRVSRISGVLRNGNNAGTLKVQFASEVATSEVKVYRGSWGRLF